LRAEVWRDGLRAEGVAEADEAEEFDFCVAEGCGRGACAKGVSIDGMLGVVRGVDIRRARRYPA